MMCPDGARTPLPRSETDGDLYSQAEQLSECGHLSTNSAQRLAEQYRSAAKHRCETFHRWLGVHRSAVRSETQQLGHAALWTMRRALATQRPHWGVRFLNDVLRRREQHVNLKCARRVVGDTWNAAPGSASLEAACRFPRRPRPTSAGPWTSCAARWPRGARSGC